MKNEIQLPDDLKGKEELRQILERIQHVVPLDQVFLSREQVEGELAYHFVILVADAKRDRIPEQEQFLVSQLTKAHPYFRLRLFTEAQLVKGFEKGWLFFLQHVCLGTQVHSRPQAESRVGCDTLSWKGYTDFMAKAGDRLTGAYRKIRAHTRRADVLIGKGDHRAGVQELYRAFMKSFRFLERMALGQVEDSQFVLVHLAHCLDFYPDLKVFSHGPGPDSPQLLTLLDHCHENRDSQCAMEVCKAEALGIRFELNKFNQEIVEIQSKILDACEGPMAERLFGYQDPKGTYLETFDEAEERDFGIPDQDPSREAKADGGLFDPILALKEAYADTLFRDKVHRDRYTLPLWTTGHLDAAFRMTHILQVCVLALNAEWPERPFTDHAHTIGEVITHALELMPYGELEFLDKLDELLEGYREGAKENATH